MPSSSNKAPMSEEQRKIVSECIKKWHAENKGTPEYIEHQRKASMAGHKKFATNKTYRKKVAKAMSKGIRAAKDNPESKAKAREAALANPYFNGEKNAEVVRAAWTEERRQKARERMIAYNKSKAGRKMASKRQKKTLSDPATKQRWMDGRDKWISEHKEWRSELSRKTFAPIAAENHRRAEQRKAISCWREMYHNGGTPIVKPLPHQPQEYYDDLDEFFGEFF